MAGGTDDQDDAGSARGCAEGEDAPPVLTKVKEARRRPRELVTHQHGQMIKYATAIRTHTASTEVILRRFTRNASHPTYAAMLEVGRAQKTIFVARYLRLRDLQREIEEGLNRSAQCPSDRPQRPAFTVQISDQLSLGHREEPGVQFGLDRCEG